MDIEAIADDMKESASLVFPALYTVTLSHDLRMLIGSLITSRD
jgi:hypothetical protein